MPSVDVDFPATVLDVDDLGSYELFKGQAKALVDAKNAVVVGVRVVDFGQGDCTEVRTQDGKALLYVDMGGGCGKCARTNPCHDDWSAIPAVHVADPATKLQLGDDPSVVMTHWDEDHFVTATRVAASANLRWLVPRQKIAKSHVAFVESLTDVRCWPAGKIRHCFSLSAKVKLKIEKCSKAGAAGHKYDRNLDGLAVFIVQHTDDKGLVPGETIVLPGDAPYQYIPTLRESGGMPPGKVIGLLAFHHGSKTHWSVRQTEAALPRVAAAPAAHKLVYTYGEDVHGVNNFNLANRQSKGRYYALGWRTREDTAGNLANVPPLPAERGDPPDSRRDRYIAFSAPA